MSLSPLARRYDHVLLDLDGCVWVGDEPTPDAPEAIAALRAAGKGVCFVTNDARHATEEFVRKLWRLGFQASVEEVVTVGGALQHVLAERFNGATAFVVGAPPVHKHVRDAGLKVVNGTPHAGQADVVVAAGHEGFWFDELKLAVQCVLRGAPLLGAGRDKTFPMPDGPWPGTAAVLAAIEAATGAEAEVVGKPAPQVFVTALDRLGVVLEIEHEAPPRRHLSAAPDEGTPPPPRPRQAPNALVVGDRLDSDLAGAHAAGLDGAVVLSGVTSQAEAALARDPAPVAVAATLADLVLAAR